MFQIGYRGHTAWGSRRRRRGRAAMMVFAVMGGVLASPGGLSAALVASPNTSCAAVLFVGARGSGQAGPGTPGWTSSSADPLGLGGTISGVYSRLRSDTSGHRTVAGVSVNYTASAVSTLIGSPGVYFAGIDKGVTSTLGTLRQDNVLCPHQQIVLARDSQ